jgi:hypothetical protein
VPGEARSKRRFERLDLDRRNGDGFGHTERALPPAGSTPSLAGGGLVVLPLFLAVGFPPHLVLPITDDYRKYVSSLSLTRLCQNLRYQSCFETLIVGWNFRTVGMLYLAILEGIHS